MEKNSAIRFVNMTNLTDGYNLTIQMNDILKETHAEVLVTIMIMCCIWIILVNSAVFVCLILHRHDMKTFVNMQLLSFSITDIFVGMSAIPGSLTLYITPSIEVCTFIMYTYFVAQTATLYHAFGICVHRYVTVKYRQLHAKRKQKGQLKRVIIHVIVIWLLSIGLVVIPVASFATFDQSITECSLNTIFQENYIKLLAVLNVVLLLPQVGTNVVYVCLYRYLSAKWKFNDRTKLRKQEINPLTNRCLNTTMKAASDTMLNNSEYQRFNELTVDTKSEVIDVNVRMLKSDKHLNGTSCVLGSDTNVSDDKMAYLKPRTNLSIACKDHLIAPQNGNVTDVSDPKQTKYDERAVAEHLDPYCDVPQIALNVSVNAEQCLQTERDSRNIPETDNQNASSYSSWANISRQITSPDRRKSSGPQREKEVLCTIGIILILLNIFITPLNLLFVTELIHDGFLSRNTKFVLMFLALVNSGLNPLVYAFKMKPFKDALKCRKDKCAALCRIDSSASKV